MTTRRSFIGTLFAAVAAPTTFAATISAPVKLLQNTIVDAHVSELTALAQATRVRCSNQAVVTLIDAHQTAISDRRLMEIPTDTTTYMYLYSIPLKRPA